MFRIFGFKSITVEVFESIANASDKKVMMMAIFRLHSKFYENVDFDYLFFNVLDRMPTIDILEDQASYLDISSQVIIDDGVSNDKLKEVLLDWIYNEPYFKNQITNEIPLARAEFSSPPIANVSFL